MDLGLVGRTYIVGGASRGLGRATAAALHAEGASVVIAARDQRALDDTARRIGLRAWPYAVDLADPHAGDILTDYAVTRTGRVDGALLNVGGPAPGNALDIDDDAWRGAFESAFLGPLRLARVVARRLGRDGALLFLLSSSVRSPISGLATSNGLRPGLAMVAKQLSDELGPRGIRVNVLLPGRIATERVAQLDSVTGDPATSRARYEAAIPLRRYGDPAELGRVAAFLLSPAASYVTGTALAVDGGAMRCL